MPVSLYGLTKRLYRTLAPRQLDRTFFAGKSAFSRQILRAKKWLETRAAHDELYDAAYYARQEREMFFSSRGIATSIHDNLPEAKTVVDVGCGSGAVLDALRAIGMQVHGLEYSEAALAICRKKGLDVVKFDLESDEPSPDFDADLVLSTEVAEHLPPEIADTYVDCLTRYSDIVIMTAATPGQGGTDHVNEQPNAYWIEKFADRGFDHDPSETKAWRDDWRIHGVDRHRAKNVMIFRKSVSA